MRTTLTTCLVLGLILSCISALAEPWPWADDAGNANEVSILLMGDTNIQGRENPAEAYRYVRDTLLAADIRFANLEVALAGHSTDPLLDDIPHKTWMHSEPDQVTALTSVNMSGVGVANNVNYPWQAVMKSLSVLDAAGVSHVGGGKDRDAAHAPLIVEAKGTRVGFLQYAATVFPFNHAATATRPGIAEIKVYTAYQPPPNLDKPGQPPIVVTWLDEDSRERMQQDINALASRTDVVIVSYHWGVSGTTEVVSYQSEIGRVAIDAGADLVFGHGPHKYQKVELYDGRPILHSIAQFVFDDRLRLGKHKEGLLVRLLVRDRKLVMLSLVPSWRDDTNLVRLYSPREGKGRELFGYLQSVNGPDGARLELVGDEIVVPDIRYADR